MKKKILFVYDQPNEELWKDGLWAAVKLLEKDFAIEWWNLPKQSDNKDLSNIDFVLGWGSFDSPVAQVLKAIPRPNGLCLGGYSHNGINLQPNVLFYETEWTTKWLHEEWILKTLGDAKLVHAFGVNKDIYQPNFSNNNAKIWDYITVGAFASWKRQEKLGAKSGLRMAVGQIQKDNLSESIDIVGNLLLDGVMISDTVPPETLAMMYNASKTCYIPANIMGGGERAVLEARACGINVEVESDNPKLQELLTSPIWDQQYYATQIRKGVEEVLSNN